MKPLFRASYGWLAGCALLLVVLFGCTENLTDPEPPLFARPAALDTVIVAATVPDTAPQDTTVFVDVLGDGFDRGSTVDFLAGDLVDPKLKVKNVHYINEKKLTVELEVDSTAEIRLYNVAVTTKRGPRGVGTELLRVVTRVEKEPIQSITVTDFTVEQVDPTEAPNRCPDVSQPCNKLTLQYEGFVTKVWFEAGINWEELYYDESVETAFRVSLPALLGVTDAVYPDENNTVTTYWQGQWRPIVDWECVMTVPGCPGYGPTEFLVDRGPNSYVFNLTHRSGNNGVFVGLRNFQARAYYQGVAPSQTAYAYIDDFGPRTITRGKKVVPLGGVTFTVQVFSNPVIHNGSTTLVAYASVMLTAPDGSQSIVAANGHGFLPTTEPDIWKSLYSLSLDTNGCYSARVVGVVTQTFEGHNTDRFAAWDPAQSVETAFMYTDGVVEVLQNGCGN